MNQNEYLLKSITLSTEKFSDFLTMSDEDAGEFFKGLVQCAIDGTRQKFSNPWKANMYGIYERTILEQMSASQTRRQNASKQAKEREKEKKEALKLAKSEKAKTKADAVKVAESVTNTRKVTEAVAEDVSTSETISEDLTFAHFVSILGKRDSNSRYNSDAENLWQRMSDDSKRKAMTWVEGYAASTPNMNSRQFPYSLITSHPWE